MLAVPAFQASTQTPLISANNKPPLEVVVANLTLPRGDFPNTKNYLSKFFKISINICTKRKKYVIFVKV